MNVNQTMADAADTAVAKARPVLDRISTMAGEAADKAADMKGQAKGWISAQGDQLSARQKQVVDSTASYISANPFKALGVAVVAALIVGRLMK